MRRQFVACKTRRTALRRTPWASAWIKAEGLDIAIFREQHEDNVAGLIAAWYNEHRRHGGAPDEAAEILIAEIRSEH